MIYIGNDIVEVSRIQKFVKDYKVKFLDKIFTKNEQNYCNHRAKPEIHFAGRFAGKEAVKKILLQIEENSIPLKNIEIKREIDGSPKVYFNQILQNDIQISISHTDDYATAVAILER